jgi:RNA polymerase sigma factor (TIGR02999 family)
MGSTPLKDYASALYDQLRAIARARMAGQRAGHTLDPTGLANEAIVRLLKCDAAQINDEEHFLKLAAEAMRQVLVDHARARATQKRGGGAKPQSLDANDDEDPAHTVQLRMDPLEVIALSDALDEFEKQDPAAAQIVKLRTFAGMDCQEIGALLDLSKRTVERRWRYAMAELRLRLSDQNQDDEHERQWQSRD